MKARHALAPGFTHTSAGGGGDIFLAPADIFDAVIVAIPTALYRMCLAPSASDFLRVIVAAINAALVIAGSAVVVALTLSDDGVVKLLFSGDVSTFEFTTTLVARRLGFAAGVLVPVTYRTLTGTRPVWHLALLTAATGPRWQAVQPGGAERTTGGRVYSVAASFTSWDRTLKVHMLPSTPDAKAATSSDATPMYPDESAFDALGSTATARMWSVFDVLRSARNVQCGLAIGNWLTVKSSTSERYWIADVGAGSILGQKTTPLNENWGAYEEIELSVVAPSSTPGGTRA